jgi:pyruvate kinase
VANAIFDGSDAVMLSAETASGKYPREAVAMMAKIVCETEVQMAASAVPKRRQFRRLSISETICESVAHAAQELDMRAIAVFTETGTTARLISKYRPFAGIYAFSHIPAVCNRVNLLWGVKPVEASHTPATDSMVREAEKLLLDHKFVEKQDIIGIVAGTRTTSGSTNFLRLHVIGSQDLDTPFAPERRTTHIPRHTPERRKSRQP